MTKQRKKETEGMRVNEIESLGFVMLYTPILYDRRLDPVQKILWCILKRYRGDNDNCFPGIASIAKGLRLQKRAVYKHIERLEELGFITRHRRPGHSNLYELADVQDVYCDADGQLHDWAMDMLREAGQGKTVERILGIRKQSVFVDSPKPKPKTTPKPQVKPKKNVLKLEDAMALADDRLSKSEAAANKRKERKLKLAQDPNYQKQKIRTGTGEGPILTVNDVEDSWRVAAKEKWPDSPSTYSKWEMKDRGIAKRLCDRYTHESVIKVVETVIQNWEDYVGRFDLLGYPNMKLLAGFADSWFPEIESGRSFDHGSKRERVREEREYDEGAGTKTGGVRFL